MAAILFSVQNLISLPDTWRRAIREQDYIYFAILQLYPCCDPARDTTKYEHARRFETFDDNANISEY